MFGLFGKKTKAKEAKPAVKTKPIVDEKGATTLEFRNAARALRDRKKKQKQMLDEAGDIS